MEGQVLRALGWGGRGLIELAGDDSATPAIRLAALDMDGTLLDGASRALPCSAAAIRRAVAAGVTVILATGKARPAAAAALEPVGLDGLASPAAPGIFLQGLVVYGRGGRLLATASLPPDTVQAAFEYSGAWRGTPRCGGVRAPRLPAVRVPWLPAVRVPRLPAVRVPRLPAVRAALSRGSSRAGGDSHVFSTLSAAVAGAAAKCMHSLVLQSGTASLCARSWGTPVRRRGRLPSWTSCTGGTTSLGRRSCPAPRPSPVGTRCTSSCS